MSIKSLLCIFSGERYDLNALESSFNLAEDFHARLRILHIAEPPILAAETLGVGGYGMSPYGGATAVEILEKDARNLHEAALRLSREYAGKHFVELEEDVELGKAARSQKSVIFRTRIGAADECLNAEGRSVDLIIAGFDNSFGADLEIIRAALFKTARPTLLLPRVPGAVLSDNGTPQTVVVAWDGSLSAARSLRDSLPFLLRAKDVYLLVAEEAGHYPAQNHMQDVLAYLECHQIFSESIHLPRIGGGVGERLLEKSGSLGADLLIMGAYGHGHLGEALLGGTTRYVLEHSHIPLLLSH